MLDSAGHLLWSRQLGGAQDEECDSIAIDDVGNLYAAGKYDGALNFCDGLNGNCTGAALPSPGASFRKFLWLAKFDGASGHAIAQASYGQTSGSHTPKALAVTSTGVVVAGSFTATLPFASGISITSQGIQDAFVARIDFDSASAFVPRWASALGSAGVDEFRGVAVDSSGNVVATGIIAGAAQGTNLPSLTPPGTNSAMALFRIDGATGVGTVPAGTPAGVYGNNLVSGAAGDGVAINRQAAGPLRDQVVISGDFGQQVVFPSPVGQLDASGLAAFVLRASLQ
jgi:hypothetical protein